MKIEHYTPDPLHSGQTVFICWIMPGPICLVIILIPAPRQPLQVADAPLLDPFLKVQQHDTVRSLQLI